VLGLHPAAEALGILYDEWPTENAAERGLFLIERLAALNSTYPSIIKGVRAHGFKVCLLFQYFVTSLIISVPALRTGFSTGHAPSARRAHRAR
jgi:acetylornithine/succinyldiaminopimelate/putrescine aminotransferase